MKTELSKNRLEFVYDFLLNELTDIVSTWDLEYSKYKPGHMSRWWVTGSDPNTH